MKISFLRALGIWRRLRRGPRGHLHHLAYGQQVEALMARANPDGSWMERANWIIDVAEWLRREPRVSLLDENALQRKRSQRLRFLLDWLDVHRDCRRAVQMSLQKTLREAAGPELFCATGLPREAAFFGELSEHVIKTMLPRAPSDWNLSALLMALFPEPADADWLLGLNHSMLSRVWKLIGDDGIAHTYRSQIDEAMIYLVTVVVAVGISPNFQQRLEPRLPFRASPFMALRRELEAYLLTDARDEAALRSVRMLLGVCRAQTDRIYAHLDEYGISVGLVYSIERMRAQLARIGRLIDLHAMQSADGQASGRVQALLVDLITAHHRRSSLRGLLRRNFSMLARKLVERNASHGEHYIARDRTEYRAMLNAAYRGGIITAFTALGKIMLSGAGPARFFEGAVSALNYSVSFLTIQAVGGALATKQPAVTAPALAAKMGALDTVDGLRALVLEIAWLLRSQSAAVFGNLMAVIPTMIVISLAIAAFSGAALMPVEKAQASLHALSIFGPTPLFAALTGVLLWLSSLAASFADNWFALRQLREALACNRRLRYALGTARAARWAQWLENNVAGIAGNVSIGIFLGMTPVLSQFFGLPLDVRHVTLSTGTLTAAVMSLGWDTLATPEFWFAGAGIAVIGLLNVGVAFTCALALALRAREVPARVKRVVLRTVWKRFCASPFSFFLPARNDVNSAAQEDASLAEQQSQDQEKMDAEKIR